MENHHFQWEKLTISMAIFNGLLYVYQRVATQIWTQTCWSIIFPCPRRPSMFQRSGAKPKAAPKVVAAKEVPETKEAEATFFWENFGPGSHG